MFCNLMIFSVLTLIGIVLCDLRVYFEETPEKLFQSCTTKERKVGKYLSITNCSQNVSVDDIEFFIKNSPIICCASKDSVPGNILDTKNGNILETNSTEMSSTMKLNIYIPETVVGEACMHFYGPNYRAAPFFVGGVRSLANEQPHMAAIGWTKSDGKVTWNCGGSLISEEFVLSAAHCFDQSLPDIVRVGDLDLTRTETTVQPQNFQITQFYVHPQYKYPSIYHDIALIQISPNVKFSISVRPACLYDSNLFVIKKFTAMGYGTIQFGGPQSLELLQGDLYEVPHNKCRQMFPISETLPQGIIESQVCAQDPDGVKDTCQGDSGGPLQYSARSNTSYNTVIGITSFGQFCAGPKPGIYTKVYSYLDWISNIAFKKIVREREAFKRNNPGKERRFQSIIVKGDIFKGITYEYSYD